MSKPLLDIAICTYNNSESLAEVLNAISKQTSVGDDRWTVTVVDNNSTDNTPQVASDYKKCISSFSLVSEPRQGLTHARVRAFKSTQSAWVAFVDDDCLLAEDWVENAIEFIERNPAVSSFNGHINLVLKSAEPLPWVRPEMFAAKNPYMKVEGKHPGILYGAGLVLNRRAVELSGWLDAPLIADRRGKSLISGGDSELSARVRGSAGHGWYVPQCTLDHVIDQSRLGMRYLMRLNFRLAESGPATRAMLANSAPDWHQAERLMLFGGLRTHVLRLRNRSSVNTVAPNTVTLSPSKTTKKSGIRGYVLALCRGAGAFVGYLKIATSPNYLNDKLLGLATVKQKHDSRCFGVDNTIGRVNSELQYQI